MRRIPAALGLFLALLIAPKPSQATSGDVQAQLRALEKARSGAEMKIRLELSWDGRPEQHLIETPRIDIPKGAALRTGVSRSRFDGNQTRWAQDSIVTLPTGRGPWQIGPASVVLRTRDGNQQERQAAAIKVGERGHNRKLMAQALGNGMVLAVAFIFARWRYRRIKANEPQLDDGLKDLLERAEQAAQGHAEAASAEFLSALLELRLALDRKGVDNGRLWSAAQIRERLERIRFGGEQVPAKECLEILQTIRMAASTSDPGGPQ